MQVRKMNANMICERERDCECECEREGARGKPLNGRLRQLDAKANAEKFRVTMMKLATL